MRSELVQIWMPCGETKYVSLQEAKFLIAEWWDSPQGFEWECRVLRACAGKIWYAQNCTTLREAVSTAFDWERLGVVWWRAALVCFDADLVISTSIELEEKRG